LRRVGIGETGTPLAVIIGKRGSPAHQVVQLKQLSEENFGLKRQVADLTLDKVVLQDML